MRRVLPWAVAAIGIALAAAGVALFAAANRSPFSGADRGWSSYAPLEPGEPAPYQSELTFGSEWSVVWTGGHLVGAGVLVLGLLVLSALGGWALGLRRGRAAGR